MRVCAAASRCHHRPAEIRQSTFSTIDKMIPRRRVYFAPDQIERILEHVRRRDAGNPEIIARWEESLADFVGVPHAAVVNSGRRGLQLTLQHFGLGKGDEIIVPAYTFAPLLSPIQELGIRPIPADIDEQSLGITPETVQARISPRTKAILALHAFGVPCDITGIIETGRRHSLPVIEDCAHSLGARVNGKQTGSFGDAAFFSFEAIKPVNTFGGGLVVSQDKSLIDRIRQDAEGCQTDLQLLSSKIRSVQLERFLFDWNLAAIPLYLLATPALKRLGAWLYHIVQRPIKHKSAYTPLQAEFGLHMLESLPERIRQRSQVSELLCCLLPNEVRIHRVRSGDVSSQYALVAQLPKNAEAIRKKLLWKGVDAGIHEELTDNCADILGFSDCPVLSKLYPRLISLPLFENMPEEQIRQVAKALTKVL